MFCSLKNVIESIKQNGKFHQYFIYDEVLEIWGEEVDLRIQKNTKIINLNNNIITIQTTTPTWKTELGFQKSQLLTIINNHLKSKKKIKDIKFI